MPEGGAAGAGAGGVGTLGEGLTGVETIGNAGVTQVEFRLINKVWLASFSACKVTLFSVSSLVAA